MNDTDQRLLILGDKPIAFHPIFARVTGSVTAALFLSQLLYWWCRRTGDSVYKTREEWEEETTLSADRQRSAIRRLTKLGILRVELLGLPARNHYFVNEETLLRLVQDALESRESPRTSSGIFQRQPVGFSDNSRSDFPTTNTENTTENTTENRKDMSADADFALFWSAKPRRGAESKKAAYRAWERALRGLSPPKRKELIERILAAQEREKAYYERMGTPPAYIPHRATWLNQERWEADYDSDDDSQWDVSKLIMKEPSDYMKERFRQLKREIGLSEGGDDF